MSVRSGYIWEEWSDEEQDKRADDKRGQDSPKSTHTFADLEKKLSLYETEIDMPPTARPQSTVSSLGLESFAAPRAARSALSPSSASNALKLAEDVLQKVNSARSAIKVQVAKNKELQSDLVRLQTARERREKKEEIHWESELHSLRQEHAEVQRKMEEFSQKVESDVKKLRAQAEEAQRKVIRAEQDRLLSLQQAKTDADKKRQRARRQWEQDERGTFEKTAAGRMEVLKKQAADALAPRLDAFVTSNKEQVAQLKQQQEAKLDALRTQLQSESQERVAAARATIRKDLQTEIDKAKEAHEQRLQELARKHELEVRGQKEKHERERQRVQENAERTAKAEHDAHQRALLAQRERESLHVQELLDLQQRELSKTLQAQSEELSGAQAALNKENEALAKQWKKQAEQKEERTYDAIIKDLLHKLGQDTESVLQRLRDDAVLERKALKTKIEKEMDDLRVDLDQKMDLLRATEEKLRSRSRTLSNEIDTLTFDLAQTQKNLPISQREIDSMLRPALQNLRVELHSAEEALVALRGSSRVSGLREEHDAEVERLEKLISHAFSEQQSQRQTRQQQSQAIQSEFEDDLSRIRQKIAAVLKKKDSLVEALQEEHAEILAELEAHQLTLENLRSHAYA